MRLDQELVSRHITESRAEAQVYIEKGWVTVNDVVATKNNKTVSSEDVILLKNKRKYVSRGGEKLEGVLNDVYGSTELIRSNLHTKSALDIGSSTGGFTDCLLQMGVEHVDAVDVGTAQTHISLLNDTRVSIFEKTDIRDFKSNKIYDVVVADLSFISLHEIINLLKTFTHKDSVCFLLIKPQFEVGKGNTKKGIVKDEDLVKEVLTKIEEKCKSIGAKEVKLLPSHIEGGDGNKEYFIFFTL